MNIFNKVTLQSMKKKPHKNNCNYYWSYSICCYDYSSSNICRLFAKLYKVGELHLDITFIICIQYLNKIAILYSLLMCLHMLLDRKSTRLNSSHANISYAVFCLKKKKTKTMLSVCGLDLLS